MTPSLSHHRLATPRAAALFLLTAFAAGASAQTVSVGLATGPSRGRVDCIEAYACDRSGTAWNANGAWRIGEVAELGFIYFDGGRFRGGDTTELGTDFGGSFKVRGLGLSAGYRWSFAKDWTVSGRFGAASVRTRFLYAAPFDGHRSKSIVAPLGGLSIAYAVTPTVSVGLDYDETRFKAHEDRGSLRMLGAAVRVGF